MRKLFFKFVCLHFFFQAFTAANRFIVSRVAMRLKLLTRFDNIFDLSIEFRAFRLMALRCGSLLNKNFQLN